MTIIQLDFYLVLVTLGFLLLLEIQIRSMRRDIQKHLELQKEFGYNLQYYEKWLVRFRIAAVILVVFAILMIQFAPGSN